MTIDTRQIRPAGRSASDAPRGVHISAVDLRRVSRDGKTLLDGVSLEMAPSSLVAIAGGSGAGEQSLLEALAGVVAVTGPVRYGGVDLARSRVRLRTLIGYVPRDDAVHRDLPVAATLRYAARL